VAKQLRLGRRHDAGGGIVAQGENGDRGLANGECRRGDNGRDQTFEALAGVRQFGRDARRAWVHLRPDMVGDETHDPLAVSGRQVLSGIDEAFGQAVDPEATIRVEHDLDDGRIFEPVRDRRPQGRAQHARAARRCFFLTCECRHHHPPPRPPHTVAFRR
jgi:hypothetical protein